MANSSSWREKRENLFYLIKKVSDAYGSDDPAWLKDYAADVVNKYSSNLDEAIACFESLLPSNFVISLDGREKNLSK